MSQATLAQCAGCSREMVKRMESGRGGAIPAYRWHAVALALDTTHQAAFARDQHEETADAGHLAIQELLLRLGAARGFDRSVELPTRSADPSRSIDVALRNDRRRVLMVLEAWNLIGDVGAGKRSFQRKLAEADALAVAAWGTHPYRITGCWVVRATRRNRTLVARYPQVFATAFPGSSRGWVAALIAAADPPLEPGLVWCDVACTRIYAWRRQRDI